MAESPSTSIIQSLASSSASASGQGSSASGQGSPTQSQATPAASPDPLAGFTPDQLTAIMRVFASAQNKAAAMQADTSTTQPKSFPRSQQAATLRDLAPNLLKLTGSDNYSSWASGLETIVRSVHLWDYVEGLVVCPKREDAAEYDRYIQESSTIRAVIVGAVSQEMAYRYLDGLITPHEVWKALEARYKVTNETLLRAVDERLVNLRLAEGGNLPDHVALFKKLVRELDGSSFALSAHRAVEWLYKSLPPSYGTFITLQRYALPEGKDPVLNEVCAKLETHYYGQESLAGPSAQAYAATTSINQKAVSGWNVPHDLRKVKLTGAKNPLLAARADNTCRHCLDTTHQTAACPIKALRIEIFGPYNPRAGNGNGGGRRDNRQNSGSTTWRQANVASVDGPDGSKPSEVKASVATIEDGDFPECAAYAATLDLSPSTVQALAEGTGREFILDSGCEMHMTGLCSLFVSLEECVPPVNITGIGGSEVLAKRKGTIQIPIPHGDNLFFFTLRDVLYAPGLKRNLLSVAKLYDAGYDIDLRKDSASIYSGEDRDFECAQAERVNGVWTLIVDPSIWTVTQRPEYLPATFPGAFVATTAAAWHKRLGHVGLPVLRQLAGTGQIGKVTKTDIDTIAKCGTCAVGKGARLPFGTSSSSTSEPLELVHSDLTGPVEASVGGTRYVMSLIDDYSRMAWICLLKTKDEAFEAFKRLRAYLELSSGRRIKTLRTDGGGEYISRAMTDHLADAGILHQTTVPNTSQQNGVAERFFRTLFDRIRCMLSEAGMTWGWWAEAARAAVYIYNRVPHSHLSDCSSPLSVWLGKPATITDIRVFGSKCYAIDTSKNRKKSTPRSVECRLLGFDTESKAYRLQVAGSVKVIKSRDVMFHEDHSLAPPEVSAESSETSSVGEINNADGKLEDSVGESEGSVGELGDSVGELGDSVGEEPTLPEAGTEVRRSDRLKQKVNVETQVAANLAELPKTYQDVKRSEEAEEWIRAIHGEFGSWRHMEAYEVEPKPEDVEILTSMLLFSRKTNPQGEEIRKKARCVVLGNRQSLPAQGTEAVPAAAPVASATSFRLLAAKAAREDCEFQQMDVNTAYLHAPLSRPTYLAIPPGFPESELIPGVPRKDQVLKLRKAVYGLREAPHCWYAHCSGKFLQEGFTRSDNDQCLFSIFAPGSKDLCHVLTYVDDFTLVTKTKDQMDWLKSKLTGMFDIKDLGEADQVLGLEVQRDRAARTLTLTQRKFSKRLLEEYGMLDCRPMDTPMLANATTSLPSYQTPLTEEERLYMRDKDYKRLLGCLNWLSQGTRPEISYAVSRLGQAQSNPHPAHWQALIHVLRYLSGTLDMGLTYSALVADPDSHMYTDSAYADCPDTRKSHSGFVALMAGAAVSWSSKRQSIVTKSSTEAEYIAMGHAAREARWLTRLMADIGVTLDEPLRIFADNQSSLILADSEKTSSRTKHLDVQYHLVREEIQQKRCRFIWVPTKLNAADVFTKPLGPTIFQTMPPMLGMPWKRRSFTGRPVDDPSSLGSKARVGVLDDGVVGEDCRDPAVGPDRRI